MLHFGQVYPLNPRAAGLLSNARKVIVVENNATGQFAALLRQELGVASHELVRGYDGSAFAVEELVAAVIGQTGSELWEVLAWASTWEEAAEAARLAREAASGELTVAVIPAEVG